MNQSPPQIIADKIKHYLEMFLAKKGIDDWKAEIPGTVDEYNPGRFFFFPVDDPDFSSFTFWPVESELPLYSLTIGFDDNIDDTILKASFWPYLKSVWPEYNVDTNVIEPFVINFKNSECKVLASFDKDPDKNQDARIIVIEFEIENNHA